MLSNGETLIIPQSYVLGIPINSFRLNMELQNSTTGMSWEIKAGCDADRRDDNDSSSNYCRLFHRSPVIKINTLLCGNSLRWGSGDFVYTSARSCRHFQNACDYSVIVLPMMRYCIYKAGPIDRCVTLLRQGCQCHVNTRKIHNYVLY